MHSLAIGIAVVVSLAIIAIGTQYVVTPRVAMRSFGLPLPEEGENIAWWLRLKGVRDIVSGLAILALMASGGPRTVGLLLCVYTLIPAGDMLMVLAGKGSPGRALGIHGVTAIVMLLAAVPLATGMA